MRARVWDTVSLAVITAGALGSALVHSRLPQRIATHFDIRGNPDGWMPRDVGAFFLPAFTLVLWIVVRLSRRILPAKDKARLDPGLLALTAALLVTFMTAVHAI